MKRSIIGLVALSAAVACGDDDRRSRHGAGGDEALPSIASLSPADGERRVSVLADVAIAFDAPLDPASVTAHAVKLYDATEARLIFGALEYDADAAAVRFAPRFALERGHEHRLELAGLRAADGRALPEHVATFRTAANPSTTGGYFSPGGERISLVVQVTDDDGRPVEERSYGGPGLDGTWGTQDDPLVERVVYEYEHGEESRAVYYDDPGLDGEWETPDDVPFQYLESSGGPIRTTLAYIRPGLDGTWFTADDELGGRTVERRDDEGRLEWRTSYNDPGPDAIWDTEDDVAPGTLRNVYDEHGYRIRQESYAPGPDGEIHTDDDVVVQTHVWVWQEGALVFEASVTGPGTDAVWNTPDDEIASVALAVYDDEGRHVRTASLSSAGADGVWSTSDDEIASYVVYAPDRKGLHTRKVRYANPGADLEWFTADDSVSQTDVTSLDDAGNRTRLEQFDAPGPDGRWFTGDDRIRWRSTFDPAK